MTTVTIAIWQSTEEHSRCATLKARVHPAMRLVLYHAIGNYFITCHLKFGLESLACDVSSECWVVYRRIYNGFPGQGPGPMLSLSGTSPLEQGDGGGGGDGGGDWGGE